MCRLSPVVFQREGTKIVEKDSRLFADLMKAFEDREASWKVWAYANTEEFRKKYGSAIEFDELGEPTFLSLINAMGLTEDYNKIKSIDEVKRDYGFTNKSFEHPVDAIDEINKFNSKEDKFIAIVNKKDDKYEIDVLPREGTSIETARQQSYNNALTGEIIDLLRSIGFDVNFISDPKYNGLFDPQNAQMRDGLITIINLAKGLRGERALPEEFSHAIIDGLINHPLVQRLLASLDDEQVREVLGDNYDKYSEKYGNDAMRLRKEAAGKMLGQYITEQGTISRPVIQSKESLLSRIWNWAKRLFSKITEKDLRNAENKASDAIKGIYNLIASGEAVPLIDKQSILTAQTLYQLQEEFDHLDKVGVIGETITAKVLKMERDKGINTKKTSEALEQMRKYNESDRAYSSISTFLTDTKKRIEKIAVGIRKVKKQGDVKEGVKDIKKINSIAKLVKEINTFIQGYEEVLEAISTFDSDDNMLQLGLDEDSAKALANPADKCLKILNELKQWKGSVTRNIVYNAARTVYQYDKVRGVGNRKYEVMALDQILDHASKDISYADRWLTAMSDADNALLGIFDSIVKNQQYERDIEANDYRDEIAAADKKLRDAGYSSDFMYERDAEGVPTGRIISEYDWETYNNELKDKIRELRQWQQDENKTDDDYRKRLRRWKNSNSRLIEVYVNPEYERMAKEGKKNLIPEDAITELMPNPKVYDRYANRIEQLAPAQKEYYEKMMFIKRTMMTKIPHRGQAIYRTIYISKDFGESIIDNSTGSPLKATFEQFKKNFVRRPDDLGFGIANDLPQTIETIIRTEKDPEKATESIIRLLQEEVDDDILAVIRPQKIKRIISRSKGDYKQDVVEIIDVIQASNFYIVDTDFADHRIQKLPIYYTRRLHDMRLLSTDFSGSMVAYSAMAINYEKMNEVVDILEVGRDYLHNKPIETSAGNRSMVSQIKVLGKAYRSFITEAGNGSRTAGRMDDFMSSVVYEERKMDEGTWDFIGISLDKAKVLDTIKDYTGLLGLGFNVFSTFSNVAAGKLQQWIECGAGEYFTLKDYAKAVSQYSKLIGGCIAEMNSPVKKNKLSLLIQMFDPMADYYESLRNPNYSKSTVSRILGNGVLAYVGLNAGEHLLHCQTMLAMLNNIKLDDKANNEKISLFDALEVKEVNGITKLVLKEGLSYERDLIDNEGNPTSNKHYGRPFLDEKGRIKTETVYLKDLNDNTTQRYIIRQKKRIRKVNDMLNGAFGVNEKGTVHRRAILRLVMQYRQWMPAHYNRRFARAHYDSDLEQWIEGYYITLAKTVSQLSKDIRHGKLEMMKIGGTLNEYEKANLRRAFSEISIFLMLMTLCKFGGRVKDKDRNWLDKMALYQIHRMFLEVGASMPLNDQFFSNIFQMMQSPMAAIDTFEKFSRILHFWNMFDEIQTGRYQGWTEYERDLFKMIPAADQILKAWYFDDSMFSMFEQDR